MFALLEHTPPEGNPHWDLLVALPAHERLLTWRLPRNPLLAPTPIPAERAPDHRPLYLNYEGEISGNRGHVRRLDRGTATVLQWNGTTLHADLHGEHLHGRYEIAPDAAGALLFRHAAPSPHRPESL